jgi:predicted nucleotidyltransferase
VTDTGSFESSLEKLASVLKEQGVSYALIGGLAVAAWGMPRATEDIDLLAEMAPSQKLDAALRSAGFGVEWRRGGADDPIPLLLRLSSAGPEIDILCATRRWELEMLGRAVRIQLPSGLEAPVVAVADLIVLKLLAGGPRDLIDVAELLQYGGVPPELQERASERGVAELLKQVMESIGL